MAVANLLPPIINNTISAVPTNQNLEIEFKFQGKNDDLSNINSDYIVVECKTRKGDEVAATTVFDSDYKVFKYEPVNSYNTDNINKKFKISISESTLGSGIKPTDFNNPLIIRIAALTVSYNKNDFDENKIPSSNEMSEFSASVVKNVIAPPIFTATIMLDEDSNIQELIENSANPPLLRVDKTNDSIVITGNLTFENKTPEETDYMSWYQIQIQDPSDLSYPKLSGMNAPAYIEEVVEGGGFFSQKINHNFANDEDNGRKRLWVLVAYGTAKGYQQTFGYFINLEFKTGDEESTENISPIKVTSFSALADSDFGIVSLTTELNFPNNSDIITGQIYYQRRKIGANTSLWESFYNNAWTLEGENAMISFIDRSVEAGVFYEYQVKLEYIYSNNSYETRAVSENKPILLIEDIFLVTKNLTLRLKYDVDITAFKRNVVDVVTPTLGGAYPFTRRNGAQIYKTFNISALLSFNAEVEHDPFEVQDIFNISSISKIDKAKQEEISNKSIFQSNAFITPSEMKSDLSKNLNYYDQMRLYERIFRDKVMDFLYKDQIILFKSFSEGNIFIKLTNVQFTPEKTHSRNIYKFSAIATEVQPTTAEYYQEFFKPTEDIVAQAEETGGELILIAGLSNVVENDYVSISLYNDSAYEFNEESGEYTNVVSTKDSAVKDYGLYLFVVNPKVFK